MDEMTRRLSELPAVKLAFAATQLRDKQRVIQAEPIAIIGLSCRFPGEADSPEGFWELLRHGRDTLERVPADRWDADAFYDPQPETPGKMHVRDGHFIRNVADFDPLFFGISPREARSMDPQQRLLLEVCHEALERACQSPDRLRGSRTGVFMGLMHLDFAAREAASASLANVANMAVNRLCIAAGRVAYALGLQGPTVALDTACSSSLVTVHQACQSLREGGSDLALAGGVNLNLAPETMIVQSHKGMLSADGRCKSFSAGADGFGRGEGAGVVVLKRLSDAIADGDRVLALVRGSAVNHSGGGSGLTVPNGRALERLVRDALGAAAVRPDQVSYVEAQGTGTVLGDSIEMLALGKAFAGERKEPLWVGSVKTNIGHLESAAGIASLIKVVLSLQHECIPQHLHFDEPSPGIAWDGLPVRIATQAVPWPAGERRIAGVSAFGYSGTNAHVVLEGAPDLAAVRPAPRTDERPVRVLALSAKTAAALREHAARFADFLARPEVAAVSPACVAHSANAGRQAMNHRVALVGRDLDEWRAQLEHIAQGGTAPGVHAGEVTAARPPMVAFVFPAEWTCSREETEMLVRSQPVVREALERCRGASELFAMQMALVSLWRSWGIEPEAVAGQGAGEITAACVAGALSLEEGVRLSATSAPLVAGAPPTLRWIRTEAGDGAGLDHAIATLRSAGYEAFVTMGGEEATPHGIVRALAAGFVAGLPVRWPGVDKAWAGEPLVLPTYPFQRRRYWPSEPAPRAPRIAAEAPAEEEIALGGAAVALRGDAVLPAQARSLVHQSFVEQVEAVLGLDSDESFDTSVSLLALGLDSLMVVDLRRRITRTLGVTLPVERLMTDTPVTELSAETYRRWQLVQLSTVAEDARDLEEMAL